MARDKIQITQRIAEDLLFSQLNDSRIRQAFQQLRIDAGAVAQLLFRCWWIGAADYLKRLADRLFATPNGKQVCYFVVVGFQDNQVVGVAFSRLDEDQASLDQLIQWSAGLGVNGLQRFSHGQGVIVAAGDQFQQIRLSRWLARLLDDAFHITLREERIHPFQRLLAGGRRRQNRLASDHARRFQALQFTFDGLFGESALELSQTPRTTIAKIMQQTHLQRWLSGVRRAGHGHLHRRFGVELVLDEGV